MLTKTKIVYYCEHCRRHGLSKRHMEAHERKCTLNIGRECNWKLAGHPHADVDLELLIDTFARVKSSCSLTDKHIAWLHDETDGCPACQLAVLRLSGHGGDVMDESHRRIWNYEDAVAEWRERERDLIREEQEEDDRRALCC